MTTLNNWTPNNDTLPHYCHIKRGWIGDEALCHRTIVGMKQTHSTDVAILSSTNTTLTAQILPNNTDNLSDLTIHNGLPFDLKFNQSSPQAQYVIADACITNSNTVALAVRGADCCPIVLKTTTHLAVIHAGRQGTINGIARNVAQTLNTLAQPNDITCWFGPCICTICHEVNADTRTHFDLIDANRHQLLSVFSSNQITWLGTPPPCTKCQNDVFFSYRGGDATERNTFLFGL